MAKESFPSLTHLVEPRSAPRQSSTLAASAARTLVLASFYRWFVLTGTPPEPADWKHAADWPSVSDVEAAFGSWARLVQDADIGASPFMKVVGDLHGVVGQASDELESRERELAGRIAEFERERQRLAEDRDRSQSIKREARKLREEVERLREDRRVADRTREQAVEARKAAETERDLLRAALRDTERSFDAELSIVVPVCEPEQAWQQVAVWVADGEIAHDLAGTLDSTPLPVSGGHVMPEQTGTSRRILWAGDHGRVEVYVNDTTAAVRADSDQAAGLARQLLDQWATQRVLAAASGRVLSPAGRTITAEAAVAWFADEVASPDRSWPVVAWSSDAEQDISIGELTAALRGLCEIVVIDDANTSWALTNEFGKEWSLWGPSLRLYWPGLDPASSDPRAHRLFLRNRLRGDTPQQTIERIQADLIGFHTGRAWPRQTADDGGETHADIWEHLQHEHTLRLAAEEIAARMTDEVHALRARLASTGAAVESDVQDDQPSVDQPATVLEAVQIAASQARALRFAPSAFESAEDSPFTRPEQVLDALRKLDEIAVEYNGGQMGQSLARAAETRGLRYSATLGKIAHAKYERFYTFNYEGHQLMMRPHVMLGSGRGANSLARIYLAAHEGDESLPRGLIVGHVGRHLPDTTTG